MKKINYSGHFEYSNSIEITIETPGDFSVLQNYPNPFNISTTIEFQVSQEAEVEIKIFDILGREVNTLLNEKKPVGYYTEIWNGKDKEGQYVSSGVYFCRFKAGDFSDIKKIIVLK